MALAAKLNGLEGPKMRPWHLKVSYKLADDNGGAPEEGTIEEFWAGENKFKVVYRKAGFSQTVYGTERGMLRSGSQEAASSPFARVANEFIRPFRSDKERERWLLDLRKRDAGTATVTCLQVTGVALPSGNHPFSGPTYCLDADKPILRVSINPSDGSQLIHNDIRMFQDRYLPGNLQCILNGKEIFGARLESVEELGSVNEADFAPPPDATPAPRKIAISSGVATGLLAQQVKPDYPPAARTAGIQGTVNLQATIGTDGHVRNLKVVAGPSELQGAAIDAVKQWVYRPYVLNGEKVEVDTTINVVFHLGMGR